METDLSTILRAAKFDEIMPPDQQVKLHRTRADIAYAQNQIDILQNEINRWQSEMDGYQELHTSLLQEGHPDEVEVTDADGAAFVEMAFYFAPYAHFLLGPIGHLRRFNAAMRSIEGDVEFWREDNFPTDEGLEASHEDLRAYMAANRQETPVEDILKGLWGAPEPFTLDDARFQALLELEKFRVMIEDDRFLRFVVGDEGMKAFGLGLKSEFVPVTDILAMKRKYQDPDVEFDITDLNRAFSWIFNSVLTRQIFDAMSEERNCILEDGAPVSNFELNASLMGWTLSDEVLGFVNRVNSVYIEEVRALRDMNVKFQNGFAGNTDSENYESALKALGESFQNLSPYVRLGNDSGRSVLPFVLDTSEFGLGLDKLDYEELGSLLQHLNNGVFNGKLGPEPRDDRSPVDPRVLKEYEAFLWSLIRISKVFGQASMRGRANSRGLSVYHLVQGHRASGL